MKTSIALWISLIVIMLIAVAAPSVIAQTTRTLPIQQTPDPMKVVSQDVTATKKDARQQLADSRRQKKLQFINMMQTARADCFQRNPDDPVAARACFRDAVKGGVRNNMKTLRDARTACHKQNTDGAAIQSCVYQTYLQKVNG